MMPMVLSMTAHPDTERRGAVHGTADDPDNEAVTMSEGGFDPVSGIVIALVVDRCPARPGDSGVVTYRSTMQLSASINRRSMLR
jgi:hypothetical protein